MMMDDAERAGINEKNFDLDDMKNALISAALELFDEGMVLPGEGNVSLRIPGVEAMIITPTANRYRGLKTEDLVVMGLDGTVDDACSGGRRPSSEWRLHAALYRQRERVRAVVHAHPVEATAHAVLGTGIPMITEETAALLGGPVPCAPYRRTGTDDLVDAMLGSIGGGNAVLLAHHGLLACGRTLTDAMDTLALAEKMAAIHRRAIVLAGNTADRIEPVGDAHARVLRSVFQERFSTD
jgi:L-fuculose-phosphate aldolase